MLTLYITRHGETVWNTQKRMQGWCDSQLTENGISNALSLGNRLKEIHFDAIYTSPSRRTVSTAYLIKGEREIPIIPEENLREINMGEWEGQTLSALEDKYPEKFYSFWHTPHLYKSVNGENFDELKKRVLQAISSIQEKNREGNVLIVTHSIVIKTLLAFFKDYPLEKLWEPPYIKDTSLTIVELSGKENNIVLEGDLSHRQIGE
ncbi:histidine phosphatase family protein [Psychrobacillus sp. NEAU-3TGS]|uniref:histidine phosphatase family protein n=1 Tax=Psychrobacillus sp. NEAU-3TGS TaxID=2995412 RepID=UPI002497B1CC|nr:histidine phosphatase family protein [Psychrobacillus sp. NEAU-3TGS]MDI2588521.1 histidine phosphatase family protein [Psychrobacillus sp. NEAU-3TGS]